MSFLRGTCITKLKFFIFSHLFDSVAENEPFPIVTFFVLMKYLQLVGLQMKILFSETCKQRSVSEYQLADFFFDLRFGIPFGYWLSPVIVFFQPFRSRSTMSSLNQIHNRALFTSGFECCTKSYLTNVNIWRSLDFSLVFGCFTCLFVTIISSTVKSFFLRLKHSMMKFNVGSACFASKFSLISRLWHQGYLLFQCPVLKKKFEIGASK